MLPRQGEINTDMLRDELRTGNIQVSLGDFRAGGTYIPAGARRNATPQQAALDGLATNELIPSVGKQVSLAHFYGYVHPLDIPTILPPENSESTSASTEGVGAFIAIGRDANGDIYTRRYRYDGNDVNNSSRVLESENKITFAQLLGDDLEFYIQHPGESQFIINDNVVYDDWFSPSQNEAIIGIWTEPQGNHVDEVVIKVRQASLPNTNNDERTCKIRARSTANPASGTIHSMPHSRQTARVILTGEAKTTFKVFFNNDNKTWFLDAYDDGVQVQRWFLCKSNNPLTFKYTNQSGSLNITPTGMSSGSAKTWPNTSGTEFEFGVKATLNTTRSCVSTIEITCNGQTRTRTIEMQAAQLNTSTVPFQAVPSGKHVNTHSDITGQRTQFIIRQQLGVYQFAYSTAPSTWYNIGGFGSDNLEYRLVRVSRSGTASTNWSSSISASGTVVAQTDIAPPEESRSGVWQIQFRQRNKPANVSTLATFTLEAVNTYLIRSTVNLAGVATSASYTMTTWNGRNDFDVSYRLYMDNNGIYVDREVDGVVTRTTVCSNPSVGRYDYSYRITRLSGNGANWNAAVANGNWQSLDRWNFYRFGYILDTNVSNGTVLNGTFRIEIRQDNQPSVNDSVDVSLRLQQSLAAVSFIEDFAEQRSYAGTYRTTSCRRAPDMRSQIIYNTIPTTLWDNTAVMGFEFYKIGNRNFMRLANPIPRSDNTHMLRNTATTRNYGYGDVVPICDGDVEVEVIETRAPTLSSRVMRLTHNLTLGSYFTPKELNASGFGLFKGGNVYGIQCRYFSSTSYGAVTVPIRIRFRDKSRPRVVKELNFTMVVDASQAAVMGVTRPQRSHAFCESGAGARRPRVGIQANPGEGVRFYNLNNTSDYLMHDRYGSDRFKKSTGYGVIFKSRKTLGSTHTIYDDKGRALEFNNIYPVTTPSQISSARLNDDIDFIQMYDSQIGGNYAVSELVVQVVDLYSWGYENSVNGIPDFYLGMGKDPRTTTKTFVVSDMPTIGFSNSDGTNTLNSSTNWYREGEIVTEDIGGVWRISVKWYFQNGTLERTDRWAECAPQAVNFRVKLPSESIWKHSADVSFTTTDFVDDSRFMAIPGSKYRFRITPAYASSTPMPSSQNANATLQLWSPIHGGTKGQVIQLRKEPNRIMTLDRTNDLVRWTSGLSNQPEDYIYIRNEFRLNAGKIERRWQGVANQNTTSWSSWIKIGEYDPRYENEVMVDVYKVRDNYNGGDTANMDYLGPTDYRDANNVYLYQTYKHWDKATGARTGLRFPFKNSGGANSNYWFIESRVRNRIDGGTQFGEWDLYFYYSTNPNKKKYKLRTEMVQGLIPRSVSLSSTSNTHVYTKATRYDSDTMETRTEIRFNGGSIQYRVLDIGGNTTGWRTIGSYTAAYESNLRFRMRKLRDDASYFADDRLGPTTFKDAFGRFLTSQTTSESGDAWGNTTATGNSHGLPIREGSTTRNWFRIETKTAYKSNKGAQRSQWALDLWMTTGGGTKTFVFTIDHIQNLDVRPIVSLAAADPLQYTWQEGYSRSQASIHYSDFALDFQAGKIRARHIGYADFYDYYMTKASRPDPGGWFDLLTFDNAYRNKLRFRVRKRSDYSSSSSDKYNFDRAEPPHYRDGAGRYLFSGTTSYSTTSSSYWLKNVVTGPDTSLPIVDKNTNTTKDMYIYRIMTVNSAGHWRTSEFSIDFWYDGVPNSTVTVNVKVLHFMRIGQTIGDDRLPGQGGGSGGWPSGPDGR